MAGMRDWLIAGALAGVAFACGGDAGEEELEPGSDPGVVAADTQVIVVADAGLQTPESVLHDEAADVYLVSNINGEPLGRDDNGFISRVRPDGTVEALKWVDGAAANVTLNAPKGLALKGDTLFVSDIDSVRAFHRQTGQPLGARGVPDADFLNDLAVADGVLYVTDTGVDASFAPTGSAAIYRFTAQGPEVVARGEALASPNGIVVNGGQMLVAPFGAAEVRQIDVAGQPGTGTVVATMPAGQLDGIVRRDDGSFLVSSWEGSAVYRGGGTAGAPTAVVENIESPADIGWDQRRQRVLIPVFMGNRLEFHPIRP